MDIKIKDEKDLEAWLQDKPVEWAHAIAVRAALRVFPLVFEEEPDKELFLSVFRCNFISWVTLRYSDHDLRETAYTAYVSSPTASWLTVSTPESASASILVSASASASTFTVTAQGSSIASSASISSALSASSASSVYKDQIWYAIEIDAKWLVHENGANLINESLWPIELVGGTGFEVAAPEWTQTPFGRFYYSNLGQMRPIRLILEWYQALASGDLSVYKPALVDERVAVSLGLQSKGFWERDFDEILEDIERLVDGKTLRFQPDQDESYAGEVDPDGLGQGVDPDQPQVVKDHKTAISDEEAPSEPSLRDDVRTHSDEPTVEDQLGRRPFAKTLVQRINQVHKAGGHDGFAVHLHAPWGAGKTSILKMMKEEMTGTSQDVRKRKAHYDAQQLNEADREGAEQSEVISCPSDKAQEIAPNWVVVHFNAWQHERRKPPWWPLMEAVVEACLAELWEVGVKPYPNFKDFVIRQRKLSQASREQSNKSNKGLHWVFESLGLDRVYYGCQWLWPWKKLRLHWLFWQLTTRWWKWVVAIVVMIGLYIYFFLTGNLGDKELVSLPSIAKFATGVAAVYGLLVAAGRVMVFGSEDNAKFYFQLANNP